VIIDSYQLLFGTVHCIGKTTYVAGFAASESEAAAWVEKQRSGESGPIMIPEHDPIRWCPVRHCHMKFQKPWFAYKPVSE
jgi:hypothetical protein